jgi:hypothetical protein
MLANAVRLCEAKFGALYLSERNAFRIVAMHNAPRRFAEARRQNPVFRPDPELRSHGRRRRNRRFKSLTSKPSQVTSLRCPALAARMSPCLLAAGPSLPYRCSKKAS